MSKALELLLSLSKTALNAGHALLPSRRESAVLTEPELYSVLNAAGLTVPEHVVLPVGAGHLASGPVVLKVVSRDILHKSDVGGVRFVQDGHVPPELVTNFLADVSARWEAVHGRAPRIEGALVMKRVDFDRSRLGAEVIAGLRASDDFGLVGMVGLGGLKTEVFGSRLPRREAAALFLPTDPAAALKELKETLVYRDLAGQLRGSTPLVKDETWLRLFAFLAEVAGAMNPVGAPDAPALEELEFNPFLVDASGQLVPVDALARVKWASPAPVRAPAHKLRAFFEPKTVCVAGVSSKGVNMGRIILRNLLRDGFTSDRLVVIKPGETEIDGVRCVASPAALSERVDLAVLAVSAAAVPELMASLVEGEKAESMIVIPGGMAEKEGGQEKQRLVEAVLARSRATAWGGPVVCGPNSMGVTSTPGHYDTTFIPAHRLSPRTGSVRNLAFLSQSGAFTITRGSHLEQIVPRYLVSAGNQMDLGIADFVSYVATDPEVKVIAAYVEGFKPGDGLRFLEAAKAARAGGKRVILYKGGRSPEGQGTAAGHTAAIAGDYRACWHLAAAAGVLIAESFAEFEGLVRVSCALADRQRSGRRVMLMSNAGFEVVAMADQLRGERWSMELARLSEQTRGAVRAALARCNVDGLVDVKNPIDVTPGAPDSAHVEIARAVLADDGVDALILGVVPMSPALASLGGGGEGPESISAATSLARTLPPLFAATKKPMVVVIDGGPLYEPLVRALEAAGLPVFRAADEAVRALGAWL
ncbi:MAG: acetate--CoA ligase family protein [Archangium sp.]|nr:acetate--CoA ligase family protein [Archangium sp.]